MTKHTPEPRSTAHINCSASELKTHARTAIFGLDDAAVRQKAMLCDSLCELINDPEGRLEKLIKRISELEADLSEANAKSAYFAVKNIEHINLLSAEREKVERLRETVEAKAYRTIIMCKPAYVVNYDDIIEALAAIEPTISKTETVEG